MMHEVASPLEMILTIIVLGFWFLFPVGMFISVAHVDKNTDQVIRLDQLRHDSVDEDEKATEEEVGPPEHEQRIPQQPGTRKEWVAQQHQQH